MTLKGRVFPLVYLDDPASVLLSVLCDRLVLACNNGQVQAVHASEVLCFLCRLLRFQGSARLLQICGTPRAACHRLRPLRCRL